MYYVLQKLIVCACEPIFDQKSCSSQKLRRKFFFSILDLPVVVVVVVGENHSLKFMVFSLITEENQEKKTVGKTVIFLRYNSVLFKQFCYKPLRNNLNVRFISLHKQPNVEWPSLTPALLNS